MVNTHKKILLSAYACEPHQGSEPGVGWNWTIELSRLGHELWVLTRATHYPGIVREGVPPGVHVIPYDLPAWMRGLDRFVRLYYLLWQIGAYFAARRLTKKVALDYVHHITYGTMRFPSFMAMLGLPFVFGPVGGGERAPLALRQSFPFRGMIVDAIRDLSCWIANHDPLVRGVYKRSEIILCTTAETLQAIPRKFHGKCQIASGIGSPVTEPLPDLKEAKGKDLRVLFVGRMLYWKGIHLGLKAFSEFLKTAPGARLTLIGDGPDRIWLQAQAQALGIENSVEWRPWLPQQEVMRAYSQHDVFLFPSLHDSGGTVILESLAHGLPVICLDLGGPGAIIDDTCGIRVSTKNRSEAQVVKSLAQALSKVQQDKELLGTLQENTKTRSHEYLWPHVVARSYGTIERTLRGVSL